MAETTRGVETRVNPERIDHPVLAFVLNYWNDKRGERAMPSRGEILPSELRSHLGWIVMTDVLPGLDDFRYRLIGTLVGQYFFRDATGKTIREAFVTWPRPAIDGIVAIHRKCARDRAVLYTFGQADWMNQGYEEFHSLYLPLSDDSLNCNVILNAFVFDRAKVLMARAIAQAKSEPPRQIPALALRED
jgi:hypothetical protein